MADNEILKAIRIIDDKIASLQEARNRLASAFGVEDHPSAIAPNAPPATKAAASAERSVSPRNSNGQPADGGRKVQLAAFLLEHGPMSRAAIVEQSGIPEGTVSYCLSDKRFFVQHDGDGDWRITDFSKRGLEHRAVTGSFRGEQH